MDRNKNINRSPLKQRLVSTAKYLGCAVVGCMVTFSIISADVAEDDLKFGENLRNLAHIFRELNVSYVDPIDSDELLEAAADAMTRTLDPYTTYIPESEISDFEFMTTGKYGGIGALIRTKGDYTIISEPYKNTPADRAGLKAGDTIMEIDGESIKNLESSKVSNLMKGTAGTKVVLTIKRVVDDQVVKVPIYRDHIVVSGVRYYGMVSDSIGIIVHDQFTENCSRDILDAFMDLREQGAQKLIIDIRNNGGGILQEAVSILSMFVDKGTEVVSMRGRSQKSNQSFVTTIEPIDTNIPMAILVNGSSASASEIVAGALQDLDRAVLVGERTFGKGLVQSTAPINQNSYLKLTTAKYYIPSGRCIQAIDYSHRNSNGTASTVPDSLRQEFSTAAGRIVYDGGGVKPDIEVANEYLSEFSANLYSLGYIEDFANDYYKRHSSDSISSDFTLSEQEYELFKVFLEDKSIKFRSRASYMLDELSKTVEKDEHNKAATKQLDEIEEIISPDKQEGLERYSQELSRLIENDIVRRYCYAWGATEQSLIDDKQLEAAIEVLSNHEQYKELLSTASPQQDL